MGKKICIHRYLYPCVSVLLLVLCLCFAMPVAASESDEPSNDVFNSTVTNSGTITYAPDAIYTVEEGVLIKEDTESGDKTTLQQDVAAVDYCDGTLYYSKFQGQKTLFYRDNDKKPFFTVNGKTTVFAVNNGKIYYLLKNRVYRQDGSTFFTAVGMTSFSLQNDGESCIYITENAIYQYADGKRKLLSMDNAKANAKISGAAAFSGNAETLATVYTPRLVEPESNNQYYFSNLNIFYASNYGMPNCTAYAYGRAYEILKKRPNLSPNNAGKWFDYNKNGGYYSYGQTPKLGAIAVWANDSTHNQGHVAVVEKINSNGTITISESYYGSVFFQTQTKALKSLYPAKTFLGFIYILEDGYSAEQVATPSLSTSNVLGGKSVTLSCNTSGASIYYTTNGNTPTTSSTKYSGSFHVDSSKTIKAIATKSSMSNSSVMRQTVTMSQAEAPKASRDSGTLLATGDQITLSSSISGASIFYTTDGTTPTTSSTKYNGAITISKDCTLKTITAAAGQSNSKVASFKYTTWNNPFKDITSKDWFFSYVASAKTKNIVSGVSENEFSPNRNTNRATFVTILSRLDVFDTDNYELAFSDVKDNQWYSNSIAWAAANNIVNGTNSTHTHFSPMQNITREQVCVILIRFANVQGVELPLTNAAVEFKDSNHINEYAKNAVELAQRSGIVQGRTSGNFDPQGNATRAEVTSIFMRFLDIYQTKK